MKYMGEVTMDENTKKWAKRISIFLLIGICVILAISYFNGNQNNVVHIDTRSEGVSIIRDIELSRNQITWNDIRLRDDTIYNANGSCQAGHNGMSVYFDQCDTKTMNGRNIQQEGFFTTNRTNGTTFLFVYPDPLQSGGMYLWRNYSHTWQEVQISDQIINNYLVSNVINYTDLGVPNENCQMGSQHNSMMYQVNRNLGNFNVTEIYCFSSRTIVNATAFRISGNRTVSNNVNVTGFKFDWDDITNQVDDITQNVPTQLRKDFKFYKVSDVNAGTYRVKWQFTPKNNATTGKWHILSFPTEKGITQSYLDGDYMYQDPTWNASFSNGLVAYWNFSTNASGKFIDSVTGKYNASGSASMPLTTGKIGNGFDVNSANRHLPVTQSTNGQLLGTGGNTIAVNCWVYKIAGTTYASFISTNYTGASNWFFWASRGDNTPNWEGSGGGLKLFDTTLATGGWHMITASINSGSASFYIDGTAHGTATGTSWATNTGTLALGDSANEGGNKPDMYLDECGVWNRSLSSSEVTDLYNGGSGMTFVPTDTATPTYSITVAQNNPINAYTSNNTLVNFNWTVSINNATVNNWTLNVYYSNNTVAHIHQQTGLSEIVNFTVNHNDTLFSDANYIWNVNVCGILGNSSTQCATTGNRTFQIHTTAPTFVLNSLDNVSTISLPVNATLNVTTSDPELSTCWYGTNQNATLTTYTCNSTQKILFTSGGSKNITVYANDTFGNRNQSTYYFNIYDFNVTQYENADPIAEGSTATIYLLINSTSFPIGDAEAVITFNGTQFPASTKTVLNANSIIFSYSYVATAGMGNSTGKSYQYNWTYNATQLTTRTTPTTTQTIISFAIDDCSVYTYQIANISHKDEETNSYFTNTTASKMEIETLVTSNSNPNVIWSFAQSFTNRSSIRLCVPANVLNSTNMTIDMTMGYEANGYVREFFYLDNGTLDNTQYFNSYTNHNITLYDLLSSDSTTFLFEFTDENGLEVDDAIVHTYRKYIGEGVYREVERSRQDDSGQTHVHLVEEDVIYYFVITQNGHIIYTSTEYNAKCLSTPCTIELSATQDFTGFPTGWDNFNGVNFNVSSDKATRTATLTFLTDQLTPMNFSLFKYTDGEVQYINTTSLTATAGSISLSIPNSFGNSTFFASVFIDGEFAKSYWIDFKETAQDYFGTTGAILGGLMVLAIVLMAVSEGVGFIVFTVLAVFIVGLMQLIDLSWMALISILCAGGIIVWKLIKRRRGG
jgi:hypothetical protein